MKPDLNYKQINSIIITDIGSNFVKVYKEFGCDNLINKYE